MKTFFNTCSKPQDYGFHQSELSTNMRLQNTVYFYVLNEDQGSSSTDSKFWVAKRIVNNLSKSTNLQFDIWLIPDHCWLGCSIWVKSWWVNYLLNCCSSQGKIIDVSLFVVSFYPTLMSFMLATTTIFSWRSLRHLMCELGDVLVLPKTLVAIQKHPRYFNDLVVKSAYVLGFGATISEPRLFGSCAWCTSTHSKKKYRCLSFSNLFWTP